MVTNWFDEAVARTYDDGVIPLPDAGIDLLAQLAGPAGRALEFAIGTGRVALPLAARGVAVTGIELSPAMLARLRAKPGGDEASIPVVVGDMRTSPACSTSSTSFRYVWPTELDLMARLAGLRLRDRWADWDRTPLSEASGSHVSVWVKD